MLQKLIAEQEAKQSRLKQQRTLKIIQRDASIQCVRTEAATLRLRQTSDVAVQTDFVDLMADLKEQVKNLTQIVAELTALKFYKQPKPRTINRPLLAELLSDDTLSDIAEFCPDSSKNCSVPAAESPLPSFRHHSFVERPERPSPQTHQTIVAQSSPLTQPSSRIDRLTIHCRAPQISSDGEWRQSYSWERRCRPLHWHASMFYSRKMKWPVETRVALLVMPNSTNKN